MDVMSDRPKKPLLRKKGHFWYWWGWMAEEEEEVEEVTGIDPKTALPDDIL